MYFQCATIPSLKMRVYRLAVVASETCQPTQNSELTADTLGKILQEGHSAAIQRLCMD